MSKITKTKIRDFVKTKLEKDPAWSKRALLRIFEFQTREEQHEEHTLFHNGVGFTGTDGKILSSFAKQLERKGTLSEKQMYLLMKKMPKYWSQVVKISDEEKLLSLIK
jgi:hypothetical protein